MENLLCGNSDTRIVLLYIIEKKKLNIHKLILTLRESLEFSW